MSESHFYVGRCDVGRGVFAGRLIERGEVILRFTGTLITLAEAVRKDVHSMNPLQVSPSLYLDLDPPCVFFNHSCEPNAGLRDDIFLTALRPIMRDEEIRYDYSTTMEENLETMRCLCGAPGCRREVRDFHTLPESVREGYVAAGVVQSFIGYHSVTTFPDKTQTDLTLAVT